MDDDGLAASPANASAYATFVQYGDVRSASTFQFMAVCLLAHLAHGLGTSSRRRVACRFAGDVTAASLATLRRGGTESDDVVVVKTHRLNGVGRTCVDGCDPRAPRWGRAAPAPAPAGYAVPASLLFVSVRAGSARAQLAAAGPLPPAMRLAAVQRYETLERGGLAALDAYAPLFPAVAPARFALLREYLGHWQILRRCCGVQASKARTDALHGLPPRRPDACAGRDLDAVEEALFNTSLWRWRFADAGGDFFPDERARSRRRRTRRSIRHRDATRARVARARRPRPGLPRAQRFNAMALEAVCGELCCPMTGELFVEPVIFLDDGATYEKSAVEQWLASLPCLGLGGADAARLVAVKCVRRAVERAVARGASLPPGARGAWCVAAVAAAARTYARGAEPAELDRVVAIVRNVGGDERLSYGTACDLFGDALPTHRRVRLAAALALQDPRSTRGAAASAVPGGRAAASRRRRPRTPRRTRRAAPPAFPARLAAEAAPGTADGTPPRAETPVRAPEPVDETPRRARRSVSWADSDTCSSPCSSPELTPHRPRSVSWADSPRPLAETTPARDRRPAKPAARRAGARRAAGRAVAAARGAVAAARGAVAAARRAAPPRRAAAPGAAPAAGGAAGAAPAARGAAGARRPRARGPAAPAAAEGRGAGRGARRQHRRARRGSLRRRGGARRGAVARARRRRGRRVAADEPPRRRAPRAAPRGGR
ncbi:hypothetical protein JL722_2741 [Aureococcus anophagefferens]|nr:hypothetical protein JL722_2741 [Aureococcus anophagefferens]